jgi:hypothetical protein
MHLLGCSCTLQRCCEPCRCSQRNESAGNSGTSNMCVYVYCNVCCNFSHVVVAQILQCFACSSNLIQQAHVNRLQNAYWQIHSSSKYVTLCLLIAMSLQAASSQPEVQLRVLQVCNENLLQYEAFQCYHLYRAILLLLHQALLRYLVDTRVSTSVYTHF